MERIGVPELRQHASRYLERVANGETLEMTDRVLLGEGDLLQEAPVDHGVDASAALAALRGEER